MEVHDKRAQCDGKKQWNSFDAAQRHAFDNDAIYRCPHCRMWHIAGSIMKRTRELPRRSSQLYAGFDETAA